MGRKATVDSAASAPLVFESCALRAASPEPGIGRRIVYLQRMIKPSFVEPVNRLSDDRDLDQVLDPAH
jgi:hypothetical protein